MCYRFYVPSLDQSHNGPAAILRTYRREILRLEGSDDCSYQFEILVRELWKTCEECVEAMKHHIATPRHSLQLGKPKIVSWDFRALAKRVQLVLRQEKLRWRGCSWHRMTEVCLTLVGCNLSNVIQPSELERFCSFWQQVPHSQHYLTTLVEPLRRRFPSERDVTTNGIWIVRDFV